MNNSNLNPKTLSIIDKLLRKCNAEGISFKIAQWNNSSYLNDHVSEALKLAYQIRDETKKNFAAAKNAKLKLNLDQLFCFTIFNKTDSHVTTILTPT